MSTRIARLAVLCGFMIAAVGAGLSAHHAVAGIYDLNLLSRPQNNRLDERMASFWRKYVGRSGAVIGIDHFGESAPAADLMRYFELVPERVVDAVRSVLGGSPD